MTISLDKHQRTLLEASLAKYCEQDLNFEIGNLETAFLLDFILTEVGPSIYNQAVRDVQTRLLQRVNEIDAEVFTDETSYWAKKHKR